jgi:formylglycine-generating enzyme required for sulfatase activity
MKNVSIYSIAIALFFFGLIQTSAQNYQMVEVPGATMKLGATPEQVPYSYPKEFPVHEVEISDFYIGVYEITQSEWVNIMGDNPSLNHNGEGNYPVDYIDWMSAMIFCNEATLADPSVSDDQVVYYKDAAFTIPFTKADYSSEGNSAKADVYIDYSKNGYRLPTEAEWEFAARGGLNDVVTVYAGSDDIEKVGVYTKNSDWKTFPVGSKNPNQIGCYDMSGNVWEYTNDWYGPYPTVASVNPKGPETGTHRVLRGGAYDYTERLCRVAARYMALPDDKDSDHGFRLARNK